MKPRLVAARLRGEPAPTTAPPAPPPAAAKRARRGGRSPLLLTLAAFLAGRSIAKVLDWRGHAHPR